MSDDAKKMTPEEKLLALIQQDKRQSAAAPAPAAPATVAPASSPPAPSPAPIPPVPAPAPVPVTPVPAQSRKASAPAPVTASAEPASSAVPAKEAAPRLKLAEPKLPLVVPESAVSEPSPAAQPAAPVQAFVSLSPSRSAGLVLLNRVLGVVVLVLIVWVFYSVGAINPGISAALENQIAGAGNFSMTPTAVPQGAPPALDSYLEKVTARNLFVAKAQPGAGDAGARADVTGSPKDLKLVAVSMDSSSAEESMAIIRNKADSKTYFVKVGQTVGPTDYVLDRIFNDHVVVRLQKQLFDVK